jgi:hypothetical protein
VPRQEPEPISPRLLIAWMSQTRLRTRATDIRRWDQTAHPRRAGFQQDSRCTRALPILVRARIMLTWAPIAANADAHSCLAFP